MLKIETIKLKKEILDNYGNECVYCRENSWQFLTIIQVYSKQTISYQKLKSLKFPQGKYQLACYNCAYSKNNTGIVQIPRYEDKLCYLCNKELEGNQFIFHKANNNPICKSCVIKNSSEDISPELIKTKFSSKESSLKTKLRIINKYGKMCTCCGDNDYNHLALDHINNDGNKERELFGTGYNFYRHVIRNNYPDKYQLLCHNCNSAKFMFGKCWHKLLDEQNLDYISIDMYISILQDLKNG